MRECFGATTESRNKNIVEGANVVEVTLTRRGV